MSRFLIDLELPGDGDLVSHEDLNGREAATVVLRLHYVQNEPPVIDYADHKIDLRQITKVADVAPAPTWAEDFEWITRHCKCGVSIEVNDHRDFYRSATEEIDGWNLDPDELPDDVRAEMIRQDRLVRVQAYPDTPVGFYVAVHHDIGAAVKRMRDILEKDDG